MKKFCYLGATAGATGGVEENVKQVSGVNEKKFRDLVPLSASRELSLEAKGRVFFRMCT